MLKQPLPQRLLTIGLWTIALCAGALLGLDLLCWLVAEALWFQEMGQLPVLLLRVGMRVLLGVLSAGAAALFIGIHLRVAQRLQAAAAIAPPKRPRSPLAYQPPEPLEPALVERYGQMGLRGLLGVVTGVGLLLGLLLAHYGRQAIANVQMGAALLTDLPDLPQQFQFQTLWQALQALPQQPGQLLGLGALIVSLCWHPRRVLQALAMLLCLSLGFLVSGHWHHGLLGFQALPFNLADAQFGKDLSFYIFYLPLGELARFWLVGVLLFTLLAVSLLYLLANDSLSAGRFQGFSVAQRHHLYALGGGMMLTVSLSHWLSRYGRLYQQRGISFGAGYTDVWVQLPVNTALTVVAAAIGLGLLVRSLIWSQHLRLRRTRTHWLRVVLGLAASYWLLVLGVGNALPALVQRLVVQPNELLREKPFIQRTIAATRDAFGLADIEVKTFDPVGRLSAQSLQANQATVSNIRLWDRRPLLQTNRQLQQIRLYYSFPDADIDRYVLKGDPAQPEANLAEANPVATDQPTTDQPEPAPPEADQPEADRTQQVILSARELDYSAVPAEAQTWINKHLVYTHGYGFTLSPVNTIGPGGLPDYFVKDIGKNAIARGNPSLGISNAMIQRSIPINEPRIYYGALTNTYIMTSTEAQELDYPDGDTNVYNVYEGRGGIAIGSLWRRWLFSAYLRDWRMAVSRDLKPTTKLLIRRNIQQRIRTLAPFLQFDQDPYLVIANPDLRRQNGQWVDPAPAAARDQRHYLYWMVDAYTTSDRYPYADPGPHPFNYIRNTVKVVIDAYNGNVTFYIANPDPIIQAWSHLFPTLFQPLALMPPDLKSHIRYPSDLFGIQSERLLVYHMTDPQVFYNRDDQWQIPSEIYGNQPQPVEPYYLIMRLPTEVKEEFVLLSPFTPQQRNNLIAWLAGRSDGDNYGKLLLYQFPKQRLIYGPEQIEARINQEPEISQLISLWNRQGSRAIQGNLLVIPLEQSLLYVEPLYLEAERNSLPTLIRVIVSHGNQIAMDNTLPQALRKIFGK